MLIPFRRLLIGGSKLPGSARRFCSDRRQNEVLLKRDWRDRVEVDVRDQEANGFCVPVQVSTLIGYVNQIKRGETVKLSPQAMIDGLKLGPNTGTLADTAFTYAARHGIFPEGECHTPFKIKTHRRKFPIDIEDLTSALRTNPVLVCIRTNHAFEAYGGGVWKAFFKPDIPGVLKKKKHQESMPDHCMIVMGYGFDSDGNLYFLLQNSWGRIWGDQGFMIISAKVIESWGILKFGLWYPILREDKVTQWDEEEETEEEEDNDQQIIYSVEELKELGFDTLYSGLAALEIKSGYIIIEIDTDNPYLGKGNIGLFAGLKKDVQGKLSGVAGGNEDHLQLHPGILGKVCSTEEVGKPQEGQESSVKD